MTEETSQFKKTWHLLKFFKPEIFYFTKMLEFPCVLMSTHSKLVLYSLKHLLAFFFFPFLVAENQDFFSILKNISKIVQRGRILKFTVSLFLTLRMFNFPFSLFTLLNLFEFDWFYSSIFKALVFQILLISLFFSCRILSFFNLQKTWKSVKFARGHWGCSVIYFRKSRDLLGR